MGPLFSSAGLCAFFCVPVLCICYYGSIIDFEVWYCNITIPSTLPILLKADLDISYFFLMGLGFNTNFQLIL